MNESFDKNLLLKRYHRNIRLVQTVFTFFACIILFRSYHLQILGNSKLNRLADTQYKTKMVVHPKRGSIYDRNGNPLALDILVTSIGIHPHQIADKEKLRAALLKATDISPQELEKKFQSGKKFEWIQRRIPQEKSEPIEREQFKGLEIVNEYRRYYPNQQLAGQVLGAVGYEAKALGGIELSYDRYLRSETKRRDAEKDARGKLFSLLIDADEVSHDVYLTIDKNVQFMTEEALKQGAVKHKVKSGFAIVMDVKTGEILAMANYPDFNPNSYSKYPLDFWKNHAALDTFEPGSTFKTVLMGAALNSGKVGAKDRFFCENGSYRIGRRTIHDHSGHGTLNAKSILQVSSNIGITKIALKIGPEAFYTFMKNLGFGQKPGIGFIGEAGGSLRNYKTWQDIEFSNISFGQGISVSGVQMASAYAAFANGGLQQKPLLLKKIVSSDGKTVTAKLAAKGKTVMSKKSAATLTDMLHSVTEQGGTATLAHVEAYETAGKTGTAQKVDPATKGYAKNDYVSSFIGYTPVNAPRILVYVVYDTPRANGYYGGITAAPVFRDIAQNTLAYLGLPAPPASPEKTRLAKAKEKTAAQDEENKTRSVEAIRQNQIRTAALSLEKRLMPDLRGLSLRKVLQLAKPREVELDLQGSGIVIKQSPQAGSVLNQEKKWKLELASES